MLTLQDVDYVIDVCQRSAEGDAKAKALIPKINERLDALGVPSIEDTLELVLGTNRAASRP